MSKQQRLDCSTTCLFLKHADDLALEQKTLFEAIGGLASGDYAPITEKPTLETKALIFVSYVVAGEKASDFTAEVRLRKKFCDLVTKISSQLSSAFPQIASTPRFSLVELRPIMVSNPLEPHVQVTRIAFWIKVFELDIQSPSTT